MRRRRPSHATVVAYLALFVALGGTSYAAIRITGRNVVDGSLEVRDLSQKARKQLRATPVPGPAGATGAAGHDGASGRDGAAGRDGAPGHDGAAGQDAAPGGNGADPTDFLPAHVIDVDPDGSPLERGDALRDQLSALEYDGDAEEYVVRLGPGTYDLGKTQLKPPTNVDLEGVGPSLTTLRFNEELAGTAIYLTDDTAFRDLGIRLDAGGSALDVNGADARLERVWVVRSQGDPNTPVLAEAGNATLVDSVVKIPWPYDGTAVDASWPSSYSGSITGTRIEVAGDNPTGLVLGAGSNTIITDSDITASGTSPRAVVANGEALNQVSLTVRNSTLTATGTSAPAAVELGDNAHLRAGATQIDGPVTLGPGATAVCAGSWDGAFAPLGADCG